MAQGFKFQEGLPYYLAKFDREISQKWQGQIVESGDLKISPAAAVLSYGQTIFEGTKAFRGKDGNIRLFRPRDNAKRLQCSASIVGLPLVPESDFFEGLKLVLDKNIDLVPNYGDGSLYIRPLEFGSNPLLGQTLAQEATFLIWVSPVGEYFAGKGKESGLRLRFVGRPRVAGTGIGEAKVAANYVGSLVLRDKWVNKGYSDIVFGKSDNPHVITESAGSNAFVYLKDGSVVTPPLDGEILAGVTRDSVIQLLKSEFKIPVIERQIEFKEIEKHAQEMFFTGTAWTVAPVDLFASEASRITFSKKALSTRLRSSLFDIQSGVGDDPHSWTHIFTP